MATLVQVRHNNQIFHSQRFIKTDDPVAFDLAIGLRQDVFVKEQGGPADEEPDKYDVEAVHWLITDESQDIVIGTGRVVEKIEARVEQPVAKIGRIAVAENYRGQNLGHLIMTQILDYLASKNYHQAVLHAQTYATRFYEKLGFKSEGEEFIEDGLPHIKMRKKFEDG